MNDYTKYAESRKSKPYDFLSDKKGYYFAQRFRKMFNLNEIDVEGFDVIGVVDETIKRFKNKIDNNNDIKRNYGIKKNQEMKNVGNKHSTYLYFKN